MRSMHRRERLVIGVRQDGVIGRDHRCRRAMTSGESRGAMLCAKCCQVIAGTKKDCVAAESHAGNASTIRQNVRIRRGLQEGRPIRGGTRTPTDHSANHFTSICK
jgi:hypothetical protein